MSQTTVYLPGQPRATMPAHSRRGRLFYSGAAVSLLLATFLGFRLYYLHGRAAGGRDVAPPIHTLVLVHGIAMSAWMVLFLVQPLLVASGNRRAHMALGRVGAVLAACIVILGIWVAIRSTRLIPPPVRIWGVTPRQFMAVPFLSILCFGLFVAAGVYYRRRPDIHRPMMLMAGLTTVSAAFARITPLNALYENGALRPIFGPFLWTIVLATLLLVVKSLLFRRIDRWFLLAYGCFVASDLLIWGLATTQVWNWIAGRLV